ncbi:FAD-dependent oxidoreductase [Vibrio sp. Of7-15]|uniref:FAD-dependent oxidoreductase n=1 Tax=Vibrio sp. Of7-15 TaxID=2724879 RepID=UPI0023B7D121|nr:FAD-dependent oxidoreductase [Vibrio sp. Of7-15]
MAKQHAAQSSGKSSGFQPFWFRQAMELEPNYQAKVLKQDIETDVCIVGGGYTGLWTAITLKQQRPELDIVIIEKGLCGSGASGRNGGCMLTWSTKYLSLKKLYGEEQAVQLVKASEQAVYEIEAFCQTHNIDAELRRHGTLYTATNQAQVGGMEPVLAELDKHEINSWKAWEARRVKEEAGSDSHIEGYFSPAAASVQSGKLVRGLKRVAEEMGIRIFEQTPMLDMVEDNGVTIKTPNSNIYARKAVMALNAWMLEKFPQFKNKIVVVSSDMVITKPIPDKLEKLGLNDGKTVIDSRTFVHYYRTTEDGRLMLGKGGNHFSFANKLSSVFDSPSRYVELLNTSFNKLFPSLKGEEFEASWTGPSDRSVTGLPFFGKLEGNSNVFYGLGYSGNGVAQTWIGGQVLSSLVIGVENEWSKSGLTTGPKGSFPPEPIRWLGAILVRNAIRRKECAEDAEQSPNWLDKQLAKLANAAGKADK